MIVITGRYRAQYQWLYGRVPGEDGVAELVPLTHVHILR